MKKIYLLALLCTAACGARALEAVDGVYQIATPQDLVAFAKLVNNGQTGLKAVLTADLDMTGVTYTPIGSDSKPFTGTFDGQNHSITNFDLDAPKRGLGSDAALVGVTDGALVKNFSISGNIVANGYHSGVIGYMKNGSHAENIHSALNIDCTRSGCHQGAGIVGSMMDRSSVDRCSFSGTLQVSSDNFDCFAGIVAYTNTGTITSCANYGTLTSDVPNSYVGGILGYFNNTECTIRNCLNVGTLSNTGANPEYTSGIVGRMKSFDQAKISDIYMLFESARQVTGQSQFESGTVTMVTAEELASGYVAYLLNGEELNFRPTWYQTLGEDVGPVLLSTHGIIYKTKEGYGNIVDNESFKACRDMFVEQERAYCASVIATRALIDEYLALINEMAVIDDFDEFVDQYESLDDIRTRLNASAAAYSAFIARIEEIEAYLGEHPEIEGNFRNLLEEYLDDTVEPNSSFPNGSVGYILETHLLTSDELAEETAFANRLLDMAINGGAVPGTDMTSILKNADFSAAMEGWDVDFAGVQNVNIYGGVYAVEWKNATGCVEQTLTGLKPGIYEFQMNAAFRPSTQFSTSLSGAMIYANENVSYVTTHIEDMITPDKAVNMENCYIDWTAMNPDYALTSGSDTLGYLPNNVAGYSYAFKGGRYLNRILVRVGDEGTLTIGLENFGSGITPNNDNIGFGCVRLVFCGEVADAAPYCERTLPLLAARAQTLLALEADNAQYKIYPNYSAALRQSLQEAVDAVATVSTAEEKFQLVQKFSDLFREIRECKKAYIHLYEELFKISDIYADMQTCGVITEAEYYAKMDELTPYSEGYENGSFSTEEAWNTRFDLLNRDEEGVALIATKTDLIVFAGTARWEHELNARLVADIDEVNFMIPELHSTFDGDYHTVNVNIDHTGSDAGFVRYLYGTLKNLVVRGTVAVTEKYAGGVVGRTYTGALVSSVESYVTIDASIEGDGTHGGIVGLNEGTATLENCLYAGTMTGEKTDRCGGLVGWASGKVKINNCLQVATIGMSDSGSNSIVRNTGNATVKNTFYTTVFGSGITGATETTTDKVASGEVCYLLNGSQSDAPVWFQTLGEDSLPTIVPGHGTVYFVDGKYSNSEDAIATVNADETAAGEQGIYNLAGQRLTRPTKGIYIVNGRKVLYRK
mgnify:CR=1 FL=1